MHQPTHPFDDGSPFHDLGTEIAVVGMSGRFAGARDLEEFWHNLRNGIEAIAPLTDEDLLAAGVKPDQLLDPRYVKRSAPLPDMEKFDAGFFGLTPREASIMDPQHRHFLECAWEALENAGHPPDRFPGLIGVFAGSGHNAYMPYNLLTNPKLMRSAGLFLVRHTGNDKDFLTTRLSYLLDLKGPSINIQTACSTSLVSIHMALQALLHGECDMALAGGVTIELPHRRGYIYEDGEILSPDGRCRAFDADARGTVFGSGVGVVALRRLADAIADGDHIHAVIKGSAINNDGSGKVGYLAPSVDGQAQAIAEALAIAEVSADTIGYVEAHGTGTPVGDPIEIAALTQAFRQSTDRIGYCGIGSVKSNIGHTDTAAGVASFIKVALAMQHQELPPTLHYRSPNPACEFERSPFYVNADLRRWVPAAGMPRRAGVSSLGVGGTNAHVVMEEAPPRAPSGPSRTHQLLVLSAKTATALEANSAALADRLAAETTSDLADVAYTLQVGRQAMSHRRALVVSDTAAAAAALKAGDPKRVFTCAGAATRDVVFMFAGGGAQYPNMGRDLYRGEPVFREAVDRCLELLAHSGGPDLRSWLFPEAGREREAAQALERPSIGLPALFTIQYAQAKLWMEWGVRPSAMIGHSMGEYVAAHLAGVFSLADALRLVRFRGQLFEELPEGAMLSVPLPVDELRAIMPAALSIAAINGPGLTVASGPVAAVEALEQLLKDRDVETARVRISVAAHSTMLEPILEKFRGFVAKIQMSPPSWPFVSNLSGTWITEQEAVDPGYWVRHLRQTVDFAAGIETLLADDRCVLLEVGPGRTLSSLARQHPRRAAQQPVFNSLRHPDEQQSDIEFALGVLGRLWAVGVDVDWNAFKGDERRQRVPLPTYRFDRQRHWIEPGVAAAQGDVDDDEEGAMNKRPDVSDWFYMPVWARSARPAPASGPGPGTTLIFEDAHGIGARLAAYLRARGGDVVLILPGRRFARSGSDFVVDPDTSSHYEAVLAALATERRVIRRIYHLWTITGREHIRDPIRSLDPLQQRGFWSLLHLAQAIGREDPGEPIELVVVSDLMQRVTTETDLVPAKATLLGPCAVIPREFPAISVRSVDIRLPKSGSRSEADLVVCLAAEPSAPLDEVIAYRSGERWVREHRPARDAARGHGRTIRPGGVYLITGGLGGIALAIARHLATTAGAKLVLIARGFLPPRAEWAERLSRNDPDDRVAARMRAVETLEALGAEVLVVSADVTNLAGMQHAVRQARTRFGRIDGVFHTAGTLDDGLILAKEEHAAAAVLAPKVQGTLVLEKALGGEPPDFILLFSSISAFAGLPGQVDYAAANAFLDAYAQARTTEEGTRVVAVDWSQWQEVGMAAALARELGVGPPAPIDREGTPVGHPFVERCIEETGGERIYASRLDPRQHWLLDEHRITGGAALLPGTGYIEIARAALTHGFHERDLEFLDVTFLAPFAVPDDAPRELRVHLRQRADGDWTFTIQGAPGPVGQRAEWTEHVRGTAGRARSPAPAPLDVARIGERCRQTGAAGSGAAHMSFGPRWQNVRRVDYGASEALIHLELPAEYAADLDQLALHPALLDMATAGAQALVPDFDETRDFFVPASYGKLRICAPLAGALISHVRYRSGQAGDDIAVYDVTIADPDGRVLVDITSFTMMRVRDKASLASAAPRRASPRAANNILALGQAQGILPEEGMRVIEHVLDSTHGPEVVVSPQDLGALLRRLRRPRPATAPAASLGGGGGTRGREPSSTAEKLVARLWSDLLGVDCLSVSDNFFDLGGHSLLGVQLINRIRKTAGISLPLTALLEAPTLETLAALIGPPDEAPTEEAAAAVPAAGSAGAGPRRPVRIRPGEGRPPLFLVHDGLGETLLYRTLALSLDPAHAVYGLQPERRRDGSVVHTCVEDMAAAHIAAMRDVQLSGPYLLAGLCAGGVIAFEMARQLQKAGETVSFVGILDAADAEAEERHFQATRKRLERARSMVAAVPGEGALRRTRRVAGVLLGKAASVAAFELSSRVTRLRIALEVNRLRRRAGAPATDASAEAGTAGSDLSFLQVYEDAHRRYRPRGTVAADSVVLFRATCGDGSPDDMPFAEKYLGDDLGWGRRVSGRFSILDMPGGHSSMLQEPHVSVLARALQNCLDEVAPVPAGPSSEPDRSGHSLANTQPVEVVA